MADISKLSRLISGVQRNVDLSASTIVVGSIKIGAGATELTQAILDKLILINSAADVDGTFDTRYNTKTTLAAQTNGASGASLVGIDVTPAFSNFTSGATVQTALEGIDAALATAGGTSFADNVFEIKGSADATKKIVFEVDGITTATTRTITMPDANVNLGLIASAIQSSEKGAANGVATLDANSLIPITQLPPAALERLVIVADQAARFALTTTTVQNGDTVKQTDTGLMYFVKDDTNLSSAAGYEVYTAGTASAVAWSGVTGTPTTLAGYGITDYAAAAKAAAVSDSITDGVLDVAPSQNAVFDALALKAPLASPTFTGTVSGITKSMVGLSDVDNTADAVKVVASAANLMSSEIAGEALAGLLAVRYAKAADTDYVAGTMYKADINAASVDNFHVVGLTNATAAVAGVISVVKMGAMAATAHGFTIGSPVWLSASGALTSTAPTIADMAAVKVGMVKDANTIDVQIQVMGIN